MLPGHRLDPKQPDYPWQPCALSVGGSEGSGVVTPDTPPPLAPATGEGVSDTGNGGVGGVVAIVVVIVLLLVLVGGVLLSPSIRTM